MGNFGKRVLIVLLAVALVVALALVGNAYQQRSKEHYISNKSAVVYSGNYNGLDYSVTKKDVWENILYSSPMSTAEEILDKYLLASYISTVTDTEVTEKINYLVYASTDEETINKTKANKTADDKAWNTFYNKMTVLGYTLDGAEGQTINDYAKLMVAFDKYATYRIENGLKVGTVTPDVSDDTLKTEWAKEYKDTYALTIKFYSSADATTFLKKYHLVVVGSRIRYYIGDSDYILKKNSDSTYYLNDDLTLPYYTQDVLHSDGTTTTEKVPNYDVETTTIDGSISYVWDTLNNKWVYSSTVGVSKKVAIDDVTSFTTSNTAYLSDSQLLALYVTMYNDYYNQSRESLTETTLNLKSFADAFGFTADLNGLYSDDNIATLNAALKSYDLVVVTYTDALSKTVQEIRKYVGNEEYVVSVTDGIADSKNGLPTYKQFDVNDTSTTDLENIPNYKIVVDANGDPVVDYDDKFQYYLDKNGERIANDGKLAIGDQTSFTRANTVACSTTQLYSAYLSMYKDYSYDAWSTAYTALLEGGASSILYNYDTLTAKRSDLATEIFSTLSYTTSSSAAFLAQPTSYDGANDSETPYYLIYKLSSSTESDPTTEQLVAYKAEKIKGYLATTNFSQMAVAELRGEAGLEIYDQFFGYEYTSDIAEDDDSNPDGITDKTTYDNYFKVKSYSSKKICALTKKVTVNGQELDKLTITADQLYDYAMKYSSSSYVSTACLNKVLLSMSAFEEIHGTSKNYLTSKNWKMKEYASATEQYNYYYEYYKQLYASYGYDYYDSLAQFLYSYGARNFDDMVSSLERGTMRNVFLYNELVGALSSLNLSDYSKNSVFGIDKFKKLYNDYFDVNVYHLLFYVDYNEDGTPDNYDDFIAGFDVASGDHKFVKAADGTPLTYTEWNNEIAKLSDLLFKNIYDDTTWSSTDVTALSEFITEYNQSSRIDGKYAEFKKLGICLEYQSLGEITNSSLSSYVQNFQDAIKVIEKKLESVDNDLLGYSTSEGLVETEYGLHYVVETAASNFDKVTFKYTDEKDEYAAGVSNDNDYISDTQIALYMQQYVYTQIFGDTDNPAANAGFAYPNLPSEFTTAVSDYFSSYFTSILDESSTYHSNYIMLQYLLKEDSAYKANFQKLSDIYYSVLFGDLS